MPELPEVETVRKQLHDEVIGKKIVDVTWDTPKVLRPTPIECKKHVTNTSITSFTRRAKQLFIDLDDGYSIGLHLRMNGRVFLRWQSDPNDQYVHAILRFEDGMELRFADSRKFGFMELVTEEQKKLMIEKYGPEPLDDLTLVAFTKIVNGSKRRVKDILMDQGMIAGIGNIYANDALWMAKIHPEQSGSSLGEREVDLLFESLEEVLKEALQDGGSSDHWFLQIHGEKGKYQEHFKVYGQKGKPCKRHPDTLIEYSKVSQRGTFVCPICQTKE